MTKPVYIINGFLESGKTEFITFTLGQPYFQIKGRTLLILCEEGENEYDPALLKKSRTDVVLIEEEEEFNPNHLIELEKQYKPARIIIEYNGMWLLDALYAAMRQFLELPPAQRAAMGAASHDWIARNFDKKAVVAETVAALL